MDDIEILVDDLVAELRERGILADVVWRFNQQGEVIGFSVNITGYRD